MLSLIHQRKAPKSADGKENWIMKKLMKKVDEFLREYYKSFGEKPEV
ncbi:hypothetical protein H8S25_07365 [Roseburia sp. NSJ-67]|uniref:Uncharacterized protein n=1 Tax=Roseburia difficilis TaxID=2763060 RepID=A0ABR7GUZ8_9FIRM|nr:hypothetical protein [Roseburia difficilis]